MTHLLKHDSLETWTIRIFSDFAVRKLKSPLKNFQQLKGILDANDAGGDNAVVENDEILEEMRRCQNELKAVSAHNLGQLRRLLKAAKEEMVSSE